MSQTVLVAIINAGLNIVGVPGTITLATAYTFNFVAKGGTSPYTFGESGSLPSGFTFVDNGNGTATLAGTSSAAGNYPITVSLQDAQRNRTSRNFTLVVQALPLSITNSATTPTKIGATYSFTYVATGGTSGYVFSVASGAIPAGLSLSSGGLLSGTPTTEGTATFTVRVTDSSSTHFDTPTQSVFVDYATLAASGAFADGGFVQPLSGSIAITGGETPYSVSVLSGTAPPGATFAVSGSTVTCTTNVSNTANGSYSFTLRVVSTDLQHVDVACTVAISSGAVLLRKKITSFWGFNSAVTDDGRAANIMGGTGVGYVTGVGGRNALGAASSDNATTTCYGSNPCHTTSKFTFGAFLKCATSTPTNQMAILLDGSTHSQHEVCWLGITSGHWNFSVRDNAATPNTYTAADSGSPATATWVFVVGVFNNGVMTLYVDGTSVGTATFPSATAINNIANRTVFRVGNNSFATTIGYDICNAFWAHDALSASEIAWMRNAGSGRIFSDFGTASYGTATADALITAAAPTGFWKLNQTSGTAATDSSTLGNGTMTNATFQNTIAAPSGFGTDFSASFNGTNAICSLPAVNWTSGNLSITQYGWFYPIAVTDSGGRYVHLGSSASSENDSRKLNVGGALTGLTMDTYSGSTNVGEATTAAAPISANHWYQICGLYDDSSKVVLLTVNGMVVASGLATGSPSAANLTVHGIGARSTSQARLHTLASRVALFKGAVAFDLPTLAEMYDVGH